MKAHLLAAAGLATALVLLLFTGGGGAAPKPKPPRGFFGVAPQTTLTDEDVRYMRAGGLETLRMPIAWSAVQPKPNGPYDWSTIDPVVETATRGGLEVLPFLAGTPSWLGKLTTLPVHNARQRAAWTAFVQAAVARYGPGGEFWREHATEGIDYEPPIPVAKPVRTWQIWNEANFFYFAYPVSVRDYAKLLTITRRAVKSVHPGAKILLSGLFGRPNAKGRKGMWAAAFLERLYRIPGIKGKFEAVALHPYAIDSRELAEMAEEFHEVSRANRDRPGLFVTEMGWGSQNNFEEVAFEQGIRGQVRQLRGAYSYLLENQRRLNLKQVHWFSWKDAPLLCNFCDSVGFFRQGPRFKPKPAWHAFVQITGGRARP
ncbi:MAG TPA: beta-galactosidase [Solirubrobacterales bacterium]|nr:beta-galactosidase [Solirubrobacterales bacterium]